MGRQRTELLYRHGGGGLVRAAAGPLTTLPVAWPRSAEAVVTWLRATWANDDIAEAVRVASPGLAERLDAICAGGSVTTRQLDRAVKSLCRYVLRAAGRHTPFGLFAGVAPLRIGERTRARWGSGGREFARMDAQWLGAVVKRLEVCPDLLGSLDVVLSDLCVERGGRLEVPQGNDKASIRMTGPVRAVRSAASSPIPMDALKVKLAEAFPAAGQSSVTTALTCLVQQGFLITSLRPPMTVVDHLGYVVQRLGAVEQLGAEAREILRELEMLRADLDRHNAAGTHAWQRADLRRGLLQRSQSLSAAGRTPLAVDLRLGCSIEIPPSVVHEIERAADVLARLSPQPTGVTEWRDYYTAFCERYGTGTLVRVSELTDPNIGLGLPAGYPGVAMQPSPRGLAERERKLLAMAWKAAMAGDREIVLDETTIESLMVPTSVEPQYAPHVEIAARIHAPSVEAVDQGNYLVTVAPARSVGTLTSRFATIAPDAGLAEVYAAVPGSTLNAVAVQLSFPPLFPHAENICRVPVYLPHVLSIGEYRDGNENTLGIDDLAVTATRQGLHLVSLSRQRVIEPQAFHALALDKQSPPIARFLAHLSRASLAVWQRFFWGAAADELPYLPRVRIGRVILSPRQWRLTFDDLTGDDVVGQRHDGLGEWRRRWSCPQTVELDDADKTLRLDLDVPLHRELLRSHLARHGFAVLTEVANEHDLGWIGGHIHDLALPLVSTAPPQPEISVASRPLIANHQHAQLPGAADTAWLYAKLFAHPDQFDDIITRDLPGLFARLDNDPGHWFIRYRDSHETDHLRLRLRTSSPAAAQELLTAVGTWAHELSGAGIIGRLVFDTYRPELGRYGSAAALTAAETVFTADSMTVADQLRCLPRKRREVLTALNMVGIVEAFLGSRTEAMTWLIRLPIAPGARADRTAGGEITKLSRSMPLAGRPAYLQTVVESWTSRELALRAYRAALPSTANTNEILESLLHMHHNRMCGVNRDQENICRTLARRAALAWLAEHEIQIP